MGLKVNEDGDLDMRLSDADQGDVGYLIGVEAEPVLVMVTDDSRFPALNLATGFLYTNTIGDPEFRPLVNGHTLEVTDED